MAKCKIEFLIDSEKEVKNLYVVGNLKELGAWDPKKAVEATYDAKQNAFVLSKMLPVDAVIEYKVVASLSWDNVEVGMWGEELENHIFQAKKGHKEELTIGYFKNI